MSHPKHVQTIERFFASSRSQTESEKKDTEEEQCINQEEMDKFKETEKITNIPENLAARSHMVAQ